MLGLQVFREIVTNVMLVFQHFCEMKKNGYFVLKTEIFPQNYTCVKFFILIFAIEILV